MKLPSAAEMTRMDQATITAGTSSLELMERAGRSIAKILLQKYPSSSSFLILCGSGNNGGDGLVIARHLWEAGTKVSVIIASSSVYSLDFKHNFDKINAIIDSGDLRSFPDAVPALKISPITVADSIELIKSSGIIVDALLGTGVTNRPRGSVLEILKILPEVVNLPKVVAVDIPTGVNPDNGQVYPLALRADHTITIQYIKRGLVQHPAKQYCGQIEVIDIGINPDIETEFVPSEPTNLNRIYLRAPNLHKGNAGSVLVIGGSGNMPGAALLSARAAIRTGAGIVTMSRFGGAQLEYNTAEIMLYELHNPKFIYTSQEFKLLEKKIKDERPVLVLGPGLGRAVETEDFVSKLLYLIERQKLRCVIDADALNFLSKFLSPDGNRFNLSTCILTPHPGEMSRLLGVTIEDVQNDRYSAVRTLHGLTQAVCLLKGASTVIYSNGHGFVNPTGNAFMATAGAGDVLSGMIGALLAQGLSEIDSAVAGAYLHGAAGDLALKQGRPLIASDLIENIPLAVNEILGQNAQ